MKFILELPDGLDKHRIDLVFERAIGEIKYNIDSKKIVVLNEYERRVFMVMKKAFLEAKTE